MQTLLYKQITDYVNNPNGNYGLSGVHRATLSTINTNLSWIGVKSQISSFLPPSDTSTSMNGSRNFASARDVPISTPVAMTPAPQRQQHQLQQPPPAQPVVDESVSLKPKLNWAVRAPAQKKEVKSLLDIQKEEMSAKQATT